ncbi:MAG: EAL domain-containing protein [Gammaproteobacteria bacterium]|jgi:diguanylate cyclase (GGDEF)-like protein|nr:EAL domain-containing protein [Gammaproteobacteria bacterium]
MRTSLGLTILVMGLLGMLLAVVTGEIYRNLAFDNQREAFSNLIKLKVDDILATTIKHTSELGQSIQANDKFRQAVVKRDSVYVQTHLDEQFHRYFVTLSIIKLEKLFTFDPDFNLIGHSSEGSQSIGPENIPCPHLITAAKQRKGAERLKTLSELCINNHKPFLTVMVPIGGVWFKGYLLAVADPSINFGDAENALGMPLTLTIPNEKVVYQSDDWPDVQANQKIIVSNYTLNAPNSGPVYNFAFAFDVEALYNKLENTRAIILGTALVATLFTALLSIILLQKTALNPLGALTHQLHLVRQDKTHLGERVKVTGNVEIAGLAEDFNDMTSELHVLYQTLQSMAFTDSLTGLPNRALFYDRLEQATYLAKRNEAEFILFMLDLDRFKYVNDTLGHHIGDELLQQIGKRLQTTMRKSDTIARLGGDEFAAILSGVHSVESAELIAKKIINLINEPVIIDNHNLTVGASIGIVRSPQDGTDNHQLMQRADMAMYHAKNNRQGYTFYESNLDQHSIIQLNLENDLRSAIRKKQLKLFYQPKIDIKNGRICGVEALVRWNHPNRGFLTPDLFIPLAEQTGLIHQLTHWVLNAALSQCALWHKERIAINVAVNLSARSLEDSQLVNNVSEALNHCGVDPQWLSLELTESAVMANPSQAMEMLTKLHRMGVKISVDDFGTGYSSLAYLKKLPVSDIKIDKSFVIDMNRDNNDAVIVHSTIDLAHNMGLSVIAEGVENQEVLDMLINLGCDVAQGYFFCKPQEADQIRTWLHQSRWGINARMKVV